MSTYRRPERPAISTKTNLPDRRPGLRSGFLCLLCAVIIPLLLLAPAQANAQAAGAQRAIEKLERCSKEERRQGCVNILKQEKSGENTLAVKAQVRGGRIIWYEYNRKSGKARRTN